MKILKNQLIIFLSERDSAKDDVVIKNVKDQFDPQNALTFHIRIAASVDNEIENYLVHLVISKSFAQCSKRFKNDLAGQKTILKMQFLAEYKV